MIPGANWENFPEHVILGLSGGGDSVALLLALLERGGRVEAAHVHHGIRGDDADRDCVFVRMLCEALRVPIRVYYAHPPENPSEDWARQVRYRYLLRAVRESCADALVLAHHLDDQAETVLMRLMRGSGLTGLTAMAPDTTMDGVRILRPLLGVSRQTLRDTLREQKQWWREDESNQDPKYLRNALRLSVMPQLEALAPGASRRMAETARLLREDEETLDGLTRAFLEAHEEGFSLPLEALRSQPVGLQKRILRQWWQGKTLTPLNRPQTEAFQALVKAPVGQRCNLPKNWHGHRGWTHLHLVSPWPVYQPPPVPVTDGAELHDVFITIEPMADSPGDGFTAQAMPPELLSTLTLRAWQPGDWIRPYGSLGRKSLQDYFSDRHVDAPFRRQIPLLCRGSEVLLVAGVGAGDVPTMTPNQPGLLLRWSGPMPWRKTYERKQRT